MKPVLSKPNLVLLSLCAAVFAVHSLRAGESSITPEFLTALHSGGSRQLRAALDEGASPNARDAAGDTPLMLAGVYGNAACLKLLLERGADVNATNLAGATPLMRRRWITPK